MGPGSYSTLWHVSLRRLGQCVVSLPAGAFTFCVIWSLLYDFESSTATHCQVANYLPSISATVGGFAPQRYVWRICIALHSAPRFAFALWHRGYYCARARDVFALTSELQSHSLPADYARLLWASVVLHLVENSCLLLLTYVSSNENLAVHATAFIGFMFSSLLYMLLNIVLLDWWQFRSHLTPNEKKSLRYKKLLFSVNALTAVLLVYFYQRHNKHCEAGMYTAFALCEYIVIASNIAFHLTPFLWELADAKITVSLPGRHSSRVSDSN